MSDDCPSCEGKGEWRIYERSGFCEDCEGTGERVTPDQAVILRLVRKMLDTMHQRAAR